MFGVFQNVAARRGSVIAVAIALAASSIALAPAGAAAAEITVTITKFHALDRADDLSNGDFFGRVTIDGEAQITPTVSNQAEVSPSDWKISKTVSGGTVKVKLELIDKDVSVDDPIDINRVDKKRDLDFTVNTGSGAIEGFSETYRSGDTITRAGAEKKKASISFKVDVK